MINSWKTNKICEIFSHILNTTFRKFKTEWSSACLKYHTLIACSVCFQGLCVQRFCRVQLCNCWKVLEFLKKVIVNYVFTLWEFLIAFFWKIFRGFTLNPTEPGSYLQWTSRWFWVSLLCLSYFRAQRSWTVICLIILIDTTWFNWKYTRQCLVGVWKWFDEFKHNVIQVKHRQNRWSNSNYC